MWQLFSYLKETKFKCARNIFKKWTTYGLEPDSGVTHTYLNAYGKENVAHIAAYLFAA